MMTLRSLFAMAILSTGHTLAASEPVSKPNPALKQIQAQAKGLTSEATEKVINEVANEIDRATKLPQKSNFLDELDYDAVCESLLKLGTIPLPADGRRIINVTYAMSALLSRRPADHLDLKRAVTHPHLSSLRCDLESWATPAVLELWTAEMLPGEKMAETLLCRQLGCEAINQTHLVRSPSSSDVKAEDLLGRGAVRDQVDETFRLMFQDSYDSPFHNALQRLRSPGYESMTWRSKWQDLSGPAGVQTLLRATSVFWTDCFLTTPHPILGNDSAWEPAWAAYRQGVAPSKLGQATVAAIIAKPVARDDQELLRFSLLITGGLHGSLAPVKYSCSFSQNDPRTPKGGSDTEVRLIQALRAINPRTFVLSTGDEFARSGDPVSESTVALVRSFLKANRDLLAFPLDQFSLLPDGVPAVSSTPELVQNGEGSNGCQRMCIVEQGGARAALLNIVGDRDGSPFDDPTWLAALEKQLREAAQLADLIVVVSHASSGFNYKLLKELKDSRVDVFVGSREMSGTKVSDDGQLLPPEGLNEKLRGQYSEIQPYFLRDGSIPGWRKSMLWLDHRKLLAHACLVEITAKPEAWPPNEMFSEKDAAWTRSSLGGGVSEGMGSNPLFMNYVAEDIRKLDDVRNGRLRLFASEGAAQVSVGSVPLRRDVFADDE